MRGLAKRLLLPRGVPHRWWNEGDEPLAFEGVTYPIAGLDAYLQAIFEIVNAGPPGRPSVFYMAHLAQRHRRTQVVLFMPPLLQRILFPVVVAIGTVLGRYRGSDWPGCPARCTGIPRVRAAGEAKRSHELAPSRTSCPCASSRCDPSDRDEPPRPGPGPSTAVGLRRPSRRPGEAAPPRGGSRLAPGRSLAHARHRGTRPAGRLRLWLLSPRRWIGRTRECEPHRAQRRVHDPAGCRLQEWGTQRISAVAPAHDHHGGHCPRRHRLGDRGRRALLRGTALRTSPHRDRERHRSTRPDLRLVACDHGWPVGSQSASASSRYPMTMSSTSGVTPTRPAPPGFRPAVSRGVSRSSPGWAVRSAMARPSRASTRRPPSRDVRRPISCGSSTISRPGRAPAPRARPCRQSPHSSVLTT